MARMFSKHFFGGIFATLLSATTLMAAPVLTNGDFEANPPPLMGDNIAWQPTPWVVGGGVTPNVIKVDGPGGFTYAPGYPALDQDASNPGAGIDQHYLDVVNGTNAFYQVFTPLCSGEVSYGAAFSTLDGHPGDSGIAIKLDSDGSVIAARQQTSLPGGNTATNPWTVSTFTANLTANTAYRFEADLNDWVVMDNAFVKFNSFCPPHDPNVTTLKTCEPPKRNADGTVLWACQIAVNFPDSTGFDPSGQTMPITISDTWQVDGAAISGVTTTTSSPEPWLCQPAVPVGGASDPDTTGCTLFPSDLPVSGTSVISIDTLFPAGTSGLLSNCASANPGAGDESCVTDVVDEVHVIDPIKPVACEAFSPEVTCNKVTGKPIVTLKNKFASMFKPKSIGITSLTPGVSVLASKSDPLSVQLTGATPGQTISLWTEAVEKGAGSQSMLDLCCMGAVEVKIPEGFVCEAEQKLEVSKTCDTGINPAINTDADCEITVHYEGPPPSASNPITLTESVTGSPWAFTTTPLSGDNWHCPAVPDATPFTCTISATDEPTANWQNWTSKIVVQMNVGDTFENCATATAAGGLQDKACWSTETPKLTVTKSADQPQCTAGQPCTFTIDVKNTSATTAYTGPITLGDHITNVSPPVLTSTGSFTAIAPPLCSVADLNSGACTGQVALPPGGVQSYSVTWMPPAMPAGVDAEDVLVKNCVDLAWSGSGRLDFPYAARPEPSRSCASVTMLPPDLTIAKTGPDACVPGQPCDYQVSISTTNQPYNGPVLLTDQAPNGFHITGVSPMPPGCGVNLPANPLACVIPVTLNAGQAVVYTITIQPTDASLASQPLVEENCASLRSVSDGASPADYSFDAALAWVLPEGLADVIAGGSELGTSCAPVTWDVDPVDDTPPTIVKTCTPLVEEDSAVLSYSTACTITVTVTSPDGFGDHLSVSDVFSGPNGGTLGALTPVSGDWSCSEADCVIGPMGQGTYQLSVPVTGIVLQNGQMATNCANTTGVPTGTGMTEADATQFPQSCVTLVPPPTAAAICGNGIPEGGEMCDDGNVAVGDGCSNQCTIEPVSTGGDPTVTKTCAPAVAGPFGLDINCTITVTSTANPQPYQFVLTETLGQYLNPTDTGAAIIALASTDGWAGSNLTLPIPPATPASLTLLGAQMPASGQSVINVTVRLMNEGYLIDTDNCVSLQARDASGASLGAPFMACTQFQPPSAQKLASTSPVLSVAKTATSPCVPNVASQTYSCGFDLTVSNAGAPFAGPMVLGDAFDAGMVSAVTATGAGWSCSLAGDAASCINGNLSLATGATSSVALDVTVKGKREGGTFKNCARIGAGDDPKAQAMIVQTALTLMGVDIGPIDGLPGKRTRAAVADLQTQLGLEPTGQIDANLLGALGVPLASDAPEACVTVDLPPMPDPPLACEKATTKLVDGECACRFRNMYQADRTSCGCVKGTEFVAGEGCIKTKPKADKPKVDKPKDTSKPLKCDAATTVLRNGKCQCREQGMTQISKTACAIPKKKREVKICPNGLPALPGIGCVNIKFGGGGAGPDDSGGAVDPDPPRP